MQKETKIGILAVLAIAGLVWGYKFLKGKNLLSRAQTFYAVYDNVDNLPLSSPVLINGLQVGTVQDQYLNPLNPEEIIVVLDVNRDIRLPKNTVAMMQTTSFLGNKSVSLIYKGLCTSDCAVSGDTLAGKYAGLVETMLPPETLNQYIGQLRESLGGILDTLGSRFSGDDTEAARTVRDVRVTIANLRGITDKLNVLLAGASQDMTAITRNLNALSANLKDNNGRINGILENTEALTADLRNAGISETVKSTNQAVQSMDNTLAGITKATAELQELLTGINDGKGTLGLLAKDPALYQNLQKTSRNLDLLLQDLRLNPKRYINVSVFGRKQKEYTTPENDPAENQKEQ